MKSLTDELIKAAVVLVVVAVALRWAVDLLRPVLPVLVVIALGSVLLRFLLRRRGV